jgi:hypothetical protein
LHLKYPKNPK